MLGRFESAEALTSINNLTYEEWVLDSSCFYHMTPNKNFFLLQMIEEGIVYMDNDQSCKVTGMGVVILKLSNGT